MHQAPPGTTGGGKCETPELHPLLRGHGRWHHEQETLLTGPRSHKQVFSCKHCRHPAYARLVLFPFFLLQFSYQSSPNPLPPLSQVSACHPHLPLSRFSSPALIVSASASTLAAASAEVRNSCLEMLAVTSNPQFTMCR